MLAEVKNFYSDLKQITIAKFIAFFLGLILISSIPYSAGIASDWFIPIAEGYRISFFYAAEMLIYGVALIVYGLHFKNKPEKYIFYAIILNLAARIISLIFAEKAQLVQVISLMRYVEVFLTIYVLANLLSKRENRTAFIAGLALSVFIECIGGLIKFVSSAGALRGIFIGIHGYQMIILFILVFIIMSTTRHKWISVLGLSLLMMGLISTQTRNGLIQLGLGVILVTVWGIRRKSIKPMILTGLGAFALTAMIMFTQKSIISVTSQRVSEAVEEGENITSLNSRDGQNVENSKRNKHSLRNEIGGNKAVNDSSSGQGTVQYRYYLWDKSLGAFLSHPLTGVGSGGFARQISELPQVFNVGLNRLDKNTPLSSHNTVLGIMAETGIIGLMAYLFWIVAVAGLTVKVLNSVSRSYFTIACCFMMFIFIASDLWSQSSFFPNMSFILGFVLGVFRDEENIPQPVSV